MNRGYTFVLSQPRSGSTLLMRLARIACGVMNCQGDNHLSIYESITTISEDFSKHGIYRCLIYGEQTKEFSDNYRGTRLDNHTSAIHYHLKCLLYGGSCSNAFAKSTIIGFGNTLTERFVQCLRNIHETNPHSLPFKLVILTRNHDDIVKSFQTKDGPGREESIKNPDKVKTLLEQQLAQFRDAYELGDLIVKYEDLVADPMAILNKIKTLHNPDESLVHKIMQNKIR